MRTSSFIGILQLQKLSKININYQHQRFFTFFRRPTFGTGCQPCFTLARCKPKTSPTDPDSQRSKPHAGVLHIPTHIITHHHASTHCLPLSAQTCKYVQHLPHITTFSRIYQKLSERQLMSIYVNYVKLGHIKIKIY